MQKCKELLWQIMNLVHLDKHALMLQVCLFSYGQTGAGKTHTMQGSKGPDGQGIIPRAILKVYSLVPVAACMHPNTSHVMPLFLLSDWQ